MLVRRTAGPYHRRMLHIDLPLEPTPTRAVTLVLPESEWRALRAAEPDAVAWLQAQVRNRLASTGALAPPAQRVEFSVGDEY